jgi:hypothetical protein
LYCKEKYPEQYKDMIYIFNDVFNVGHSISHCIYQSKDKRNL